MSAEQTPEPDPMADIVQRCKLGQRAALNELYQACHQDIYALVVRMVGRQDAADVTQHVFIQVFRKIEQFHGHSKFKTWFYRLAVNEALQHLRKNKRHQNNPLTQEPLDSRPSGERQRDAQDLLEVAIGRLDPLLRSVFVLKESHEMSYQDIAEATNIPVGTVGSRLNRARHLLRESLIELGWEQ